MKAIHVNLKDAPEVAAIVRRAFPNYKGRRPVKIRAFDGPMTLCSYWDGGSKDTFAFASLAEPTTVQVHTNHPVFESGQPQRLNELPDGVALVEHSIFCGKDMGCTLYLNPANLNRLALPQAPDITDDERIVLKYTASLKNTYGGETDIRFKQAYRETGILSEEWNAAQESLKARKLLNKAGAITTAGRNALDSY